MVRNKREGEYSHKRREKNGMRRSEGKRERENKIVLCEVLP